MRTVQALTDAKKTVILVGSVPEIGYAVPLVLAQRRLTGDTRPIDIPLETHLRRQRTVMLDFALMRSRFGARLVDPAEVLCDDAVCHVLRGGAPLYRDEHHISATAARLLIPILSKAF